MKSTLMSPYMYIDRRNTNIRLLYTITIKKRVRGNGDNFLSNDASNNSSI